MQKNPSGNSPTEPEVLQAPFFNFFRIFLDFYIIWVIVFGAFSDFCLNAKTCKSIAQGSKFKGFYDAFSMFFRTFSASISGCFSGGVFSGFFRVLHQNGTKTDVRRTVRRNQRSPKYFRLRSTISSRIFLDVWSPFGRPFVAPVPFWTVNSRPFTGFCRHFPAFYRSLPYFNRISRHYSRFYRMLPDFTGFYRILPDYTGYSRI